MTALPNHLFTASDGNLYDTRRPSWHTGEPLRVKYEWHYGAISGMPELRATLRAGEFTWPGGYPLFFHCRDGGALCFKCARENLREVTAAIRSPGCAPDWQVIGCAPNYEDNSLYCDHCSGRIEAAYGDEEIDNE